MFSALALLLSHPVQHRPQVIVHPVWPAQGTITAPFGHDGSRPHPGIDIGILRSLAVRAAIPGRVEKVGEPAGFSGYGNIVLVRSSKSYEELYAHLSGFRVHVGEKLRAGERIATAGCTGYCTGTHLHFEVRDRGEPVSPLKTVLRPLVARPAVLRHRALLANTPPLAHKPLL
jgi:murein DD-endopeptidase MepM/ murein hydrolase activator NlpD